MSELRPCPFCGDELWANPKMPGAFQHHRNGCFADGYGVYGEYLERWNRRTPWLPDELVTKLKAIQPELADAIILKREPRDMELLAARTENIVSLILHELGELV